MSQTWEKKLQGSNGGGSYFIYLPKSWIDSWIQKSPIDKRVRLREVGRSILVSPVMHEKAITVSVDAPPEVDLREVVLSAYVRGIDSVKVEGREFSVDEQNKTSSLLRTLPDVDQTVDDLEVAFKSRSDMFSSSERATESLVLLFEKNRELSRHVSRLFSHMERAPVVAHELRSIHFLEEEEVDPLSFQLIRCLSDFETVFEGTTTTQFLAITTYILERMGDTLFGMAELVGDVCGIPSSMMSYPEDILEKKIEESKNRWLETFPVGLMATYVGLLSDCAELIELSKTVVMEMNGEQGFVNRGIVRKKRLDAEAAILARIEELGDRSVPSDSAVLPQYLMIGFRIRELFTYIESLFGRTSQFFYYPSVS